METKDRLTGGLEYMRQLDRWTGRHGHMISMYLMHSSTWALKILRRGGQVEW